MSSGSHILALLSKHWWFIEAKKPRICGRQIMRDNVEAESGRLL
jgi:hypothetical protein